MCGVAGLVRFTAPAVDDDARAAVLADAMTHRGPDGTGVYRSTDGRARLVHRRLAIIDLSSRAAQPMSTPDGRFHLSFNGEIYNYRALREGLQARGIALRTESDTEVLLHRLALDGPTALTDARGMFALALWDDERGEMLVARDRFGMKPMYVAASQASVAFGSEIGALRRAGLVVDSGVSAAGVLAYLRWGSIPAPLTWLAGVEQLEPGTWRRWQRDGGTEAGRFADARTAYVTNGAVPSEASLRCTMTEALRDTVRAHLVADVPVGVFLSGGIDSGALVSLARSVSDADLHTYTVVVDDDRYSEETLAQMVADRFGTRHHTLRVDAAHLDRDADRIISALDQPTWDAVNSYYVSQAVAATGVKAVLSGVGGDEMFGGYPSFSRIPSALSMSRALGPLMRATGAAALALPAWRASKWRHFASAPERESAYRALRGFFMPEEIADIAGPALRDASTATAAADAADASMFEALGEEVPVASVARMETCGFMRTQLLRDIDAVSMAHGLEVRAPFVDHCLQQAAWPALGAYPRLLDKKRLLHESIESRLPAEIVTAPKRGFTLPFDSWMRGPLRDATLDGLTSLARRGWITRAATDQVWAAWERGDAHWSRPWGLSVLGRFLETVS